MRDERCKKCQDRRIIDSTCIECFPKEDKALYHGLMNGDNVEFKPVRYPLDDKGIFHEPESREMQIREHHREEGAIGNI